MFNDLTDLFRASGAAHGEAYADTGVIDPEWPARCAQFFMERFKAH